MKPLKQLKKAYFETPIIANQEKDGKFCFHFVVPLCYYALLLLSLFNDAINKHHGHLPL